MGNTPPAESATIERFILDRQRVLLRRAIAAVTAADDDELAFQFHRLTGSLGTYQLHAAATLLGELEARAQSEFGSTSSPDALRAEALVGLRTLSAAMESAA